MIHNKKFQSTNMVYSMFLASKFINQDVVICYGDIIFNSNVYNLLNKKGDIIPLNINWLKIWKKRMITKNIKNDAENISIKNNYLSSIGGKIGKKYPKYQYMGIFKLSNKTYSDLNKFFKVIKNSKIDMTSFLNTSIINKKIKLKVKKYKSYWYEIDNKKDLDVSSRELVK
mgnify:FL=1